MTSITTEELIERIGQSFDGECHLTEAEARALADRLAELEREREEAKLLSDYFCRNMDMGFVGDAEGWSPARTAIHFLDHWKARAIAAERSLEEAKGVIEQIGRMKLFPDDVINRTTLQAAIHLARAFLNSPSISNSAAKGTNSLPPREDGVKLEGGERG